MMEIHAAAATAAATFAVCGLICAPACAAEDAAAEGAQSLPRPGAATEATRSANSAFSEGLPLANRRDFDDASRGLIATIDGGVIKDDQGRVVWDMSRYDFLKGAAPATVNPSLWRQAKLNAIHGLFEIKDGLYQVRGYDIAVMTVIRGEEGWIVVDPLGSKETAKATFALVERELGDRPITAVLFTHSHADHFGGVRGIVTDEDIAQERVRIIAPIGFAEASVAENLLAGPAMARRARLQFGSDLPPGPAGQVDSGLGKALSRGGISLIAPTEIVAKTGERLTIDGIDFEFISAPETEAPAEFMFYLPKFRALHTAEVATGTLHNVLTLRGAVVRDALQWSQRIDDALRMFGDKSEVAIGSHNWPTWGRARVGSFLEHQRDIYRYIHDQTLRLANQGLTMHEIANRIGEPQFAKGDFSVRGYYGTINHDSKATYQRYFGWWDGVPANFNPLPPEDTARRWVALAGADAMIANAAEAFAKGDYRWVATVMNQLVFAEPDNAPGRAFLAGAYEQLGFQAESAIWRNYYLSAAQEIRHGVAKDGRVSFANPDFVKAVSSADYFDALASRLNPQESVELVVAFAFADTSEEFTVRLKDGVAARIAALDREADAIARMNRADLDAVTLGLTTFQDLVKDGRIRIEGDRRAFAAFLAAHDRPDPHFNVVTP